MAADDKIDVQITASPANFVAGVNTAQQALTNSAAQMQQSAGGMSASVRASMLSLQQNARSAMSGFGSSVTNAMSSVTSSVGAMKAALGAAGIGIVGIFGSSTKAALDYEKALLGLSRTSGMSIATSSELAFAASQVGMSTDDLTRNIGFLARSLAALEKNADSNTNAFNRFGIEVHNANGGLLPTQEIVGKVADRFQSMPDGVQKSALAMSIFGREGRAMIPFLNQGSKGLEKMRDKAKSLGLVVENVSALKSYVAAQRQWNATLKSLQIQIGNGVLPVLTGFSKAITGLLQAFNRINPETRTAIITITTMGAGLAALTLGWGAAAAAIAAFGGPFARVGVMMGAMPNLIGVCAGGIKGLVVGLADGTIKLVQYVASGKLFTAIHSGMRAAVAAARAALVAMRSAVVAVSLAYQLGGVRAIAAYCTSLLTMRTVISLARVSLLLFYSTATVGIAVVVALVAAWVGGWADIGEATAGTCDAITTGLNQFADGISQIMSGIGHQFVSLAKTIGSALVGDFSGAAESARELLQASREVGLGARVAMEGLGQAVSGAISDPEGALNFAKAAGMSIWNGLKNMLGFGGDDPAVEGETMDDPGAFGTAGGDGKETGADADSIYAQQKKLYEQQLQLAEYSAEEKEALYRRYLEYVEKSEEEMTDYKIGLYALEKDAFQESLKAQETDLENSHIRGTITEHNYQSELARIKRANLDAEAEFRAKAVMEALRLTEEEKKAQLKAYKEKVEATSWYKESLKEVLDAEKSLADYELSIQNKLLEYQRTRVLDSISLEEKRLEGLENIGAISQEELLTKQREFEEQRYSLQRAATQKELSDNAINVLAMIDAYEKYAAARTELDKEVYLNKMLLESKNEETTIAALKSLEELYAQHAEKLLNIQQKQKEKEVLMLYK